VRQERLILAASLNLPRCQLTKQLSARLSIGGHGAVSVSANQHLDLITYPLNSTMLRRRSAALALMQRNCLVAFARYRRHLPAVAPEGSFVLSPNESSDQCPATFSTILTATSSATT
jgi:hypothetical protein